MQNHLGRNRIVLLGIGHTNAHVLRMWKMNPPQNAELVCVSNFPVATYSGMLPGVLAGDYSPAEMEIDLVRLCQSAGTRLIIDQVIGLDHPRNRLLFANRAPFEFDYLSIGIGSRPSFADVNVLTEENLVAIKPMQTFLSRIDEKIQSLKSRSDNSGNGKKQIIIVGGGVGSIEIAFCLNARLKSHSIQDFEIRLVTASSKIGHQLLASTQSKVQTSLEEQGIKVVTGRRVKAIHSHQLILDDANELAADLILWATQAAPPQVVSQLGLKLDSEGFIAIRPTLQTHSHDHIFAVGDAATLVDNPTPKAGVYAVRQGPILWENLLRSLNREPLVSYKPQSGFLKLLNTGDGQAIAEYRGFSARGRWAWRLKDRIDSKFMAMYQNFDPPEMSVPAAAQEMTPKCLGCGGKIGPEILSAVIRELELPSHPDVIIGLEKPDDAAVIKTHGNQVTITTDFFTSPLNDPELTGRIAVLNSASDCFVMGAQPTAALAMIQIPHGHPRGQSRTMRELMLGSVQEISRMGAALVGGHSIEGADLTIGFTFLGRQITDQAGNVCGPATKGNLRAGDQLITSKALGTGVLLAALMRCRLPGIAYEALLNSMLQSNQIALTLIQQNLVSAITDVTGFGLAGHLCEMLTSSQKSARIFVDQIPRLPMANELLREGLESTLAPENRFLKNVTIDADLNDPRFSILFDPQTSGGILAGVAKEHADEVLNRLQANGFVDAAVIGEVVDESRLPVVLEIR